MGFRELFFSPSFPESLLVLSLPCLLGSVLSKNAISIQQVRASLSFPAESLSSLLGKHR